ncbi:MAG: IPT/TIG domain-containing protein [Prevotella sp.]|nr:IPT/TIG domain-containing protein [Prevotella sp.]
MKKNLKNVRLPMALFVLSVALFGMTACSDTTYIEDYIVKADPSPYDPSKPVTITRFTPESGGVGQQVVIYGSNFGDDPEIIDLKIGGVPAVVVSANGDNLYTYVPSKSFTGKIELTVGGEGQHQQSVTAEKRFTYERKMVVGTLCGYKNELDKQGWKTGPFRDEDGQPYCCGFRNDGVMQFSPYNHDQLFIVYDQEPYFGTTAHSIQMLDLKNETVEDLIALNNFGGQRLRTIDFAVDPFAYDKDGNLLGYAGQGEYTDWLETASTKEKQWREHLIVSADNGSTTSAAVYIVDRDTQGKFSSQSAVINLANYIQCNGAYLHPGDTEGKYGPKDTYSKELYFNSYAKGEMLRLNMDKYWETLVPEVDENGEPMINENGEFVYPTWNPYVEENDEAFEIIYALGESQQEMQIDIHPSGNFAYIVSINTVNIRRTDYDWTKRTFLPPYIIAGKMGSSIRGKDDEPGSQAREFLDGVGTDARFCRPYQGTFVKNDKYAGALDEYDFYFCDNSWSPNHDQAYIDGNAEAHAIRLMTPEGIVRTYAGGSANTHADGRVYGTENGELRDVARFDRPTGLVNDFHIDRITGEKTLIFYILDTMNRKIRTITMEEPSEEEWEEMQKNQ